MSRHMNNIHKSLTRQVVRWSVLLMFIVLAILYLNSAVYSAWVSGGPPNPYPIGWSRRALGHICFALAALFFGVALFIGIRKLPKFGKSSIALTVIGILLVASPYVGRFILIDGCLDRGEKWNNETIQCSDE